MDPFPLAEHDTPDRLIVPERLYGREREIEALLASVERSGHVGARARIRLFRRWQILSCQ